MSPDVAIFFGIMGLLGVLLLFAIFFVLYKIFLALKNIFVKIFQENEEIQDLKKDFGEDVELRVQALEESREERKKIKEDQWKDFEKISSGPKLQYYTKSSKDEKEAQNTSVGGEGQTFDEKEKKDIEERLGTLKKSAKGQDGESDEEKLFTKIEIPRPKKLMPGRRDAVASTGGGDQNSPAEEKDGRAEETGEVGAGPEAVSGRTSVVQKDRLEMLKGSEIKIPRQGEDILPPKTAGDISLEDLYRKPENSAVKGPLAQKSAGGAVKDTSIFGGESEVSRINLRQKLRYDPKIWQAEKQAGLTLNREERAKLEKEVFSQTYGRNISKMDLKWGIKKLNQKMLGTKDIAERGKIRKEIKFFKKIGGIK